MKLGNTIRQIRKKKYIPQGVFAKCIGISQNYLSQIELDKPDVNVSRETLDKIGAEFGVPGAVLIYLSIEIDDVPKYKQGAFKHIDGIVKSLLTGAFEL